MASTLRPDDETRALLSEIAAMIDAPQKQGASSIGDARKTASKIFQRWAGAKPGDQIRTQDFEVPCPEGARRARLYRHTKGSCGLVLFLHGGGWTVGSIEDYDALVSRLCAASGVSFLSLDYRLAPESPHPAALEDARSALVWAAQNAKMIDVDASKIAVMGDSAGGNLAAVLAQDALRGGTPLAGQILLYPLLDISSPHAAFPSRLQFGDGDFFLTRDAIDAARASYVPASDASRRIDASPLAADDLKGAPPAFILVGEFDPLRDEAAEYARKLKNAGVGVDYMCVSGGIHALLSFAELPVSSQAERAVGDAVLRLLFV